MMTDEFPILAVAYHLSIRVHSRPFAVMLLAFIRVYLCSSAVGLVRFPRAFPANIRVHSRPFAVAVIVAWSCGFPEKLNMRSERFCY
jgi:hypothetical protein